MSLSHYVHLEVDEILKETEAAFLVLINDEELWLPKSMVADAKDYEVGDVDCTMSIPEWLARKHGFDV